MNSINILEILKNIYENTKFTTDTSINSDNTTNTVKYT